MLSPIIIIPIICFMGSAALIPMMYLATHGFASVWWVAGASIIGTNITDIFWIALARKLGRTGIEKLWFIKKNPKTLYKLEKAVHKHGAKILFWSKFIHATGILSQFAVGIFKVPWAKAMTANFLGAVVWTGTIFLLARGVASLPILEDHISDLKIGLIVFIGIFILINIIGSRIAKKEISILED
ncbi:MAG: VTT domain-containing protein [Minisyncoccia bacterium]